MDQATNTAPALPPEQVVIQMRQRVLAGEQLSREEVRDVLTALRANRRAAAEAAGKKSAAKAPARSPAELLAALAKKPVVQP